MGSIVGVGICVDDRGVCFLVNEGFYLTAEGVGVVLAGSVGIGEALETAIEVIGVCEGQPVCYDPGKAAHTIVDAQGVVAGGVNGTLGTVSGFESFRDVVVKRVGAKTGDGLTKATNNEIF